MAFFDFFKPVTDVVNNALDLIPTEQKKFQAQAEFLKALHQVQADIDTELTKRLQADINSDSFLSKNIRPAVCILFTIYIFALPFIHDVHQAILDLYTNIAISVYGFYFGSMSLEKIVPAFFKKKEG